ncbi:MAG: VWA domain-containing protein [Burkholderiales bacterium]|nr:VWA domain-containing protein [Burkholderiales bacterium]
MSFIFTKSSIQESITTMCKVWAKRGIYVGFDKRPCTDGCHVYLGSLNGASQDDMKVALSHAAHEVNHILYTEFSHLTRTKNVKSLVNVIEDIRIDGIGFRQTPGTYLFRQDGLSILIARDQAIRPEEGDTPERSLCVALYWILAKDVLGYSLPKGFAETAKSAFTDRFGEKLFNKLLKIALKGVAGAETKDVVRAARQIANLFAKEINATKQKEEEALNSGNGKQGNQDGKQPEEGSGLKPSASKGTANSATKTNCNFEAVSDVDMAAASIKVLQNLHDHSPDDEDQIQVWPVVATPFPAAECSKFLEDANIVWGPYFNSIRRSLQAKTFAQVGINRTGTLLDTKRVYRVMTGDSRIFVKPAPVRRESAVAAVLLDRSGSMDTRTLYMAKICAYSICYLFESIKDCESACYAFPGIVRCTALEIKSFEQPCHQVASRFANIKAFGFTPLAETMYTAAGQLATKKQKRKLIIVITDGLNCEPHRIDTAVKVLEQQGFELFCLNIGPDGLNLFERQRNITHYSQMAKELSEMLFGYMRTTRLV